MRIASILLVFTISGCALTTPYEEPKAPCNSFKKTTIKVKDCVRKPLNGDIGKWV